MFTRKILGVLALVFACLTNAATANDTAIVSGKRVTISSEKLGGERTLYVHEPAERTEGKAYPLLVVLDAERYFHHGVTFAKSLGDFGYVPEMVIVGVDNGDGADRRVLLTENTTAYTAFLTDELIPFAKANFGTSDIAVIAGWQFAGRAVLNVLAETPDAYDGYIAASPWPVTRDFVTSLEASFGEHPNAVAALTLMIGEQENVVEVGFNFTKAALSARAPEGLNWQAEKLPGETHTTSFYRALHAGLRQAFGDYSELDFNDLASYRAIGGIAGVEAYFKARADKYGTDATVGHETLHTIARISLNSGDAAPAFEMLAAHPEFTERSNAYWLNRLAALFLSSGKTEDARALYARVCERFPTSADAFEGLANALDALGKAAEAKAAREKATALRTAAGE
jgi:enterochelin esterase-like enzyme